MFYACDEYEMPTKFTLSDEEPDELGRLINENYYMECDKTQLTFSRYPRIPNITSCENYLTFPEFALHYNNGLSFKNGVENACRNHKGISDLQTNISNAVNNEILYRLIKEHGANYQSALGFTFLLTEPAARNNPFDETITLSKIREKIFNNGFWTCYFEDLLEELKYQAKIICKKYGIERFAVKYLDLSNGSLVYY